MKGIRVDPCVVVSMMMSEEHTPLPLLPQIQHSFTFFSFSSLLHAYVFSYSSLFSSKRVSLILFKSLLLLAVRPSECFFLLSRSECDLLFICFNVGGKKKQGDIFWGNVKCC